MAAPPSVSTADLSGTYTLNGKLSDSMDAVLKMQGVGWLVRQAAAYSTITVTMKQYAKDGTVCLDVDQVSTGGIRSREERVLNWEWREKDDRIWGKVRGRARIIKLSDLEADEFLKSGWSQDTAEGNVIEMQVESVTDTWTAQQTWGMAEINGERRQVRKVLAVKGSKVHKISIVYDYIQK